MVLCGQSSHTGPQPMDIQLSRLAARVSEEDGRIELEPCPRTKGSRGITTGSSTFFYILFLHMVSSVLLLTSEWEQSLIRNATPPYENL
jgi:hypothetical protein